MHETSRRELIHQKLEIMKKCYIERDMENFDLFYDTFFERDSTPIVIGTDNGEWFRSMDRIRWLLSYDWEHWGALEIDSWNFSIRGSDDHDIVRTRGILDFGEDRAWDIDIIMIFDKNRQGYPCRVMQFKIPRNEIRPVVILNASQEEQDRSEKEMMDLIALNDDESMEAMRGHLAGKITSMLKERRPYLENIDVRREMIYVEESGDGFLFAMTGFCVYPEKRAVLPFRMIGIGQGYEILDAEFSHPFASSLG